MIGKYAAGMSILPRATRVATGAADVGPLPGRDGDRAGGYTSLAAGLPTLRLIQPKMASGSGGRRCAVAGSWRGRPLQHPDVGTYADLSVAYGILVPRSPSRTVRGGQEGVVHEQQRGDLRAGVRSPAEEGRDDRFADRGVTHPRRGVRAAGGLMANRLV